MNSQLSLVLDRIIDIVNYNKKPVKARFCKKLCMCTETEYEGLAILLQLAAASMRHSVHSSYTKKFTPFYKRKITPGTLPNPTCLLKLAYLCDILNGVAAFRKKLVDKKNQRDGEQDCFPELHNNSLLPEVYDNDRALVFGLNIVLIKV
ncbi:hypothetical protein Trydic_g6251 [Trypoxylus dichotomus]